MLPPLLALVPAAVAEALAVDSTFASSSAASEQPVSAASDATSSVTWTNPRRLFPAPTTM